MVNGPSCKKMGSGGEGTATHLLHNYQSVTIHAGHVASKYPSFNIKPLPVSKKCGIIMAEYNKNSQG